ncbi:hypothetical protein QN277_025477 [Acacia crassicarpa]|uniref:Reverse transcriptase n=1 Tax=Acacia crassicarpa TaxID=499986 RepID=A0AAE1K2X2_9FABA|nr:hypothetical protein QN277_025477 [Acacia crassicarpa]
MGDFNDISSFDEWVGGRNGNPRRMRWFCDQINFCGLCDLGAVSPRMTWKGPKLPGCARLYECLDKAFGNSMLLQTMPDSFLKVLPRTQFSDHNPIILSVGFKISDRRVKKPFRFEAMWLLHDNFTDFIDANWCVQDHLETNLDNLQFQLKEWNREVFGLVEKRKADLLARINGIQKSKSYPFSNFLYNLERQLQRELEEVLRAEEFKWFQKSRTTWVSKCDRNTRFYHLSTNIQRKRSRIIALKDGSGNWVEDEDTLKSLVVTHFKQIYQEEVVTDCNLITNFSFPTVLDDRLQNLGLVLSDEEIKQALFSMGPFKAPGDDRFPPVFFQANWSKVGLDICSFVKKLFNGSLSVKEANKTLITLIPKKDNLEYVHQFRHISLCSVHYKCVTKVLCNTLDF